MPENFGICQGCGAHILWVKTRSGKPMPCDPLIKTYWQQEKADGKVVTPGGDVVSCLFEGDPEEATGVGYISHFATCPKSRNFRKKKSQRGVGE